MQFVCKRVTVMYIPSHYLHLHVHNMYIVFYRELALPLFKCLTEFVIMLATETLQENSVILVNSLDTSLFKSQLFTLFNKDS